MRNTRKRVIEGSRRVVVKLGSALLAGEGDVYSRLAEEVEVLWASGREAVVVTSGAIATGMKKLSMERRPASIPDRQAVAAVGQVGLMALYDGAFAARGMNVAQVLLTHDDLGDRKRFLNARNTILTLLKHGIVPVINENDTVATDEIKFGDNDELSALVTNLSEADLLIILTDIEGLYDRDPRAHPDAELIDLVEDVDKLDPALLTSPAGRFGTGGIRSKCMAAGKAAHFGAATVVANGFKPGIIGRILASELEGTLFLPKEDRLTSKKHWIAFSTRPTGRVFVDEGARDALLKKGRSLLPSGIKGVDGDFDSGEVVHCVDMDGMEFARGVSNYSSREIERIKGMKTRDIEGALGYRIYDEVIHRDNLVVI